MDSAISIVMVETTHPGNIGAAARVIANMGLNDLRLVNPRLFPHPDAEARAAGANHVLENAKIYQTLREAISRCNCVIGTTARQRSISWPVLTPGQAIDVLLDKSTDNESAIVFGPEACGLSNEHLDLCNYLVNIEVDPGFSSLNVATAVAVLAYEYRRKSALYQQDPKLKTGKNLDDVTVDDFDMMIQHLEVVLKNAAFLPPTNTRLMRKIRKIFMNGVKSRDEINILRGIFSAIQEKI